MADSSGSGATFITEAFRDLKEMIDNALGEGSYEHLQPEPWRSVFLRRPSTRNSDLQYLAERLEPSLKIFRSVDRRLLKERAALNGHSKSEEKMDLLRTGLLWASAEIESPQTLRLGEGSWLPKEYCEEWSVSVDGHLFVPRKVGRLPITEVTFGQGKYVTGGDGRQIKARPLQLPFAVRLAWYIAGAKRAAVLALRDEPWASAGPFSLQEMEPLEESMLGDGSLGVAEDVVWDRLGLDDLLERIDRIRFTPTEQRLFDAFLELLDWSEAGDTLDMTAQNRRQTKRRILRKLEAAGISPR
jgi:hypothetical protein